MTPSIVALGRSACGRTIVSSLLRQQNICSRQFSDATKNVGFIGLGNMGGHMAMNLANKVTKITNIHSTL